MKVSDYVIRFAADLGVKHVSLVSGGGAIHLNDSLGRCPAIEFLCNHHEQANAIAAETFIFSYPAPMASSFSPVVAVCVDHRSQPLGNFAANLFDLGDYDIFFAVEIAGNWCAMQSESSRRQSYTEAI